MGENPYLIDETAKRMKLRRSHFDGLFFQWTATAHFNTFRAWINNLQVSGIKRTCTIDMVFKHVILTVYVWVMKSTFCSKASHPINVTSEVQLQGRLHGK